MGIYIQKEGVGRVVWTYASTMTAACLRSNRSTLFLCSGFRPPHRSISLSHYVP